LGLMHGLLCCYENLASLIRGRFVSHEAISWPFFTLGKSRFHKYISYSLGTKSVAELQYLL
jgi:hypothetical protein